MPFPRLIRRRQIPGRSLGQRRIRRKAPLGATPVGPDSGMYPPPGQELERHVRRTPEQQMQPFKEGDM